jgi:methyl-accepting chemotaxis protein
MNLFNNMKVGTKLIAGFLAVAAISALVGTVGITKIRQIAYDDTMLYKEMLVPLEDLADMAVSFQRIRIDVRDAIEATDEKEVQGHLATVKQLRQRIGEVAAKFEKTIIADEGRMLFSEFKESRNAYIAVTDKVMELDAAKKDLIDANHPQV